MQRQFLPYGPIMEPEIKIGKHRLASRVLVAPMSGVTDLPFRRLLQRFSPGLIVSEMVVGEGLSKGDPEGTARAAGGGEIDPLVIQLVGREAHWMGEGAKLSEAAGADIIDINMGCPARKVTSGLSGSALMRDLDHAMTLVEAVVASTAKPVTLKMRLGWDHDSLNAPELAKRAEDAGVQMLVVHGRTRCQFYQGEADWTAVAPVVQAVDIPVFVNGDIHSPTDALTALDESGAAGVMVGRGLIGRPWHVRNIMAAVDGTPIPELLSARERLSLARGHYRDMLEFYGEGKGLRVARKHLAGYIDHSPECAEVDKAVMRGKICRSVDPIAVIAGLATIFGVAESEQAA